eukprot:CAMPEP_0174984826 /NCGR_PEP_ID=MMETSP0004_2-20121128/17963_1 /TAXON_ID=420556 /ORGANISM="Ochromonas sp., Strain CCMP1393" /LENGTH=226 /DNA_ID=CAMNT_0016237329 /DNA_START=27 /DNA_END=707 /DNA_ORIENTATION=-
MANSWWYKTTTFYLVGVLLSMAYFIAPTPYTKPLPILALSSLCWMANNIHGDFIASGLILSSIGDIFLELDDTNLHYFIGGLIAFLIGHVLYVTAFLSADIHFQKAKIVSIFLALYFIVFAAILLPHVESILIGPVLLYMATICAMIFLAFMRYFSIAVASKASRLNALIGSIFFVISDSILAYNKFAQPIENAKTIVMITYYTAQTFLAASTCQEPVVKRTRKAT